jgi:protein involved in polysaccharide export with SLBB domain
MTRFKFLVFCITAALFLNNCSKILEPVSLFGSKQDVASGAGQEEFKINIKSLTFKAADKANNAPYSRRLIQTGSGSSANVFDEANFLKANLPELPNSPNYLLGIGDQISYDQMNEFETKIARWPSVSKKSEYLLGAGDKLTFVQSIDNSQDLTGSFNDEGQFTPDTKNDELVTTEGVIGSNGNILLFGLGKILAANRTLNDVRTEVRNILIRNGLAPNFQLEISSFESQKAFVNINNIDNKIISLNNLPITLKEVALGANLSVSNKNFALIKLTRNGQEYRLTAAQLFELSAPEIIIQDNDQIDIQIISGKSIKLKAAVGSKGNILLPEVGILSVVNKTIDDVHKEISSLLIADGIKPNFQLELLQFISKKVYLLETDGNRKVVPLTNSNATLRQLLFENNGASVSANKLSVITLKRNGQVFRMTREQILDPKTPNIWVIDGDHIEIESMAYKLGQVFALSGAGNAQMITIDPSKRETLADILFAGNGALNNLLAKRSEVYLLRGKNPSVAYHLDAQNVSRILVAAKTELRPNDIVYVADRPIISFSRTLAEILPLRILLRDIQENNIP